MHVRLPSSMARLYGNRKKRDEKYIPLRTYIQLCNEIIGEHRPITRGCDTDRFLLYRK